MQARMLLLGGLAALACGLAGCQPKNNTATEMTAATADDGLFSPHKAGRYAGLGVYQTGTGWTKLAVSGQPQDPAAARTADDEHVIVLVDSKTGEIRQCGDLSGYCIGMNPWAKPLGSGQGAPVPLTAHANSTEPVLTTVLSTPVASPTHHHRHASGAPPLP